MPNQRSKEQRQTTPVYLFRGQLVGVRLTLLLIRADVPPEYPLFLVDR